MFAEAVWRMPISAPLPVAARHVQSHPALTDVVFGDFVHAGAANQPSRHTYMHNAAYVQRAYMHKRSAHNPLRRCRGKLSPRTPPPSAAQRTWIDIPPNAHLRFPLAGPARPTPADVKTIPAH